MHIFRVVLVAGILLLGACSDEVPAVADAPEIKPEDLVKVTKGFVCGTSEQFTAAATHAATHEKTKFKAMFDDGECWQMPDDVVVRVVHVEFGKVELAPNTDSPTVTVWTGPEWVVVQPSVPKS